MAKIGFVGLGNMGGPMAANLVKQSHTVRGFDLQPEALHLATAAGIEIVNNAESVTHDADAVITMLPAGKHVLSVYADLLPKARKGTLFIDCSTIDVNSARAAHDQAHTAGMLSLDAPVSGGTGGAAGGTLTFMAGGTDAAYAAAQPILSAMGRKLVHCGGPGAGQAAKICNNMILGISMIAVSEAFVLAEKLGLSHQALFDVASTSSGQCWSLTTYCPVPGPVPTSPANNAYQPGFAAALMLKDLRLSQEAAAATGADTALGRHATDIYTKFETAGRGGADFSAIIQAIRTTRSERCVMSTFETILIETRDRVALLTLNRPKALNALNLQVMTEVVGALEAFERDDAIGCIVITGSEKAFAAGADIKEMQPLTYQHAYATDWFAGWDALNRIRKPIIAAVSGFALGGGCELALMCDFILASDTAKFGQPEIKLGVIPGIGGSQRLTRAIGKAKAMEMCLTGRMMDAAEAERSGLVSRIVPTATLLEDAIATAQTIADMSLPVAMMAKEAVNRAFETTLTEGVRFERRIFHATFALNDQKEGMTAFIEKRKPGFTNQ